MGLNDMFQTFTCQPCALLSLKNTVFMAATSIVESVTGHHVRKKCISNHICLSAPITQLTDSTLPTFMILEGVSSANFLLPSHPPEANPWATRYTRASSKQSLHTPYSLIHQVRVLTTIHILQSKLTPPVSCVHKVTPGAHNLLNLYNSFRTVQGTKWATKTFSITIVHNIGKRPLNSQTVLFTSFLVQPRSFRWSR